MKENIIICDDQELWAIKMSLWCYRNFLSNEKENGNKNVVERERLVKDIIHSIEKKDS
ncbi:MULTISPECIES: hypothetical protein [Clostridium]|uniref:hypothetical protein n=1 Tax=Clostridium TaxID=1485 RepID=UPI000A8AD819|nr:MULTISPECIES: hypothetical protein [Clostridium]MCD2348621.1 hypothetical protein [Clostridium guangxiense]